MDQACHYCGESYAMPVAYHHDEVECARNRRARSFSRVAKIILGASILAALLGVAQCARAQFVPGQLVTAVQLNTALANPNITGGSVATGVLNGNFLLSNFNGGSGATANTCWLGNMTWGPCVVSGPGGSTVGVVNGGTGVSSASPTAIDNISGFSGTGFINRTGPGAYSFIASPIPVANGGTAATSASGTALDNITGFSGTGILRRTGAGTYTFGTTVSPAEGGTGLGAFTRSGNTTTFATTSGSLTSGNCAKFDASGNVIDAGGACAVTIAAGTIALATSAISSAACSSEQTSAATGVATTDTLQSSFSGDPTAVTGYIPSTSGMLTIIGYTKTDFVAYKVCNNTSGSITPGAITLNWRVVR